jgi:hypothetical protein
MCFYLFISNWCNFDSIKVRASICYAQKELQTRIKKKTFHAETRIHYLSILQS